MIFYNSQQNIEIYEEHAVKNVGLRISGGADSAIVGYMLGKFIVEERPDIKIIPITTIHAEKPFQEIYSKKIINFLRQEFGEIFLEHQINTAIDRTFYITAQDDLTKHVKDNLDMHVFYHGLTSNPPADVLKEFNMPGPTDNRNGKNFPTRKRNVRLPLANIDKKGVAELYKTLGVMESLYPNTRSCEEYTLGPFETHCEKCWWCKERHWGFGRYT